LDGSPTPLTGNDLKSVVVFPHDYRLQQPGGTDRGSQLGQRRLVELMARLVWIGTQTIDGNFA
jgi:hypothetical protein